MLKVFGFVRRAAHLTHDEYRTGHVGYHNSYGRRLPNIRGYILNVRANRPLEEGLGSLAAHITRNEPEDFDEQWDGWGQLMFDDHKSYLAGKSPSRDRAGPDGLMEDPLVAEVGGDMDTLYNGSPFQFHVEEKMAKAVERPERKLYKLAQFGKKPKGMSDREFKSLWTGRYASLVGQIANLRGHIINFRTDMDVMTGFFGPESEAFTEAGTARRQHFYDQWDGIAELWMNGPEQYVDARKGTALGAQMDEVEDELFEAVWYREVDETVVVMPNRGPIPDFYYR